MSLGGETGGREVLLGEEGGTAGTIAGESLRGTSVHEGASAEEVHTYHVQL